MLEKALYELNYELNNRPDWLRIPLAGILRLLTDDLGIVTAMRTPRSSARSRRRTACGSASGRSTRRAAAASAPQRRRRRRASARASTATGIFETWVRGRGAPAIATPTSLDGDAPLPDPASRFQPDGVHGPRRSSIPAAFAWTRSRAGARARPRDLIVYELHVGTFSPGRHVRRRRAAAAVPARPRRHGDRADAGRRFRRQSELGLRRRRAVRAVARLRHAGRSAARWSTRRTRTASRSCSTSSTTISGPRAPTCPQFSRRVPHRPAPRRRGARRSTSTAPARLVRRFILDNAAHWVREYHVDGLRLDATHALIDDSPKHDRPGDRRTVTAPRLGGRSSSTPRTTGTSPPWSRTRRSAAGGWTASGPTTSTTSSGA